MKAIKSDIKEISAKEGNAQEIILELESPGKSTDVAMENEKSVLELPTARESISVNHLERNNSTESLAVSERVFYSPLLRESVTSEYESEVEIPGERELE